MLNCNTNFDNYRMTFEEKRVHLAANEVLTEGEANGRAEAGLTCINKSASETYFVDLSSSPVHSVVSTRPVAHTGLCQVDVVESSEVCVGWFVVSTSSSSCS